MQQPIDAVRTSHRLVQSARRWLTRGAFLAPALLAAAPAAAQEPNFGRAIALTDSELIIGQPVNWYGPGVVYVYGLGATGEWVERARLTASDSSRMDDFGGALAIDGHTLIVGAPRKHDGTGVAYVFERDGASGDWREVAILEPPVAGEEAASWASALVLAGDDLLVGAPAAGGSGAVHHFTRGTDGSWTLHATLRPSVASDVAGFGARLSMDGNRLLVGAPGTGTGTGHAFAFERQPGGDWSAPTPLDLPAAVVAARARIGASLLLHGDTAFVGVPGAASVVVLTRSAPGSWSSVHTLQPSDTARSMFGAAMTRAGGELWVGAPGVNEGNGRVYRFAPAPAGGWGRGVRLDADSADGTAWPFAFGLALASAGDRVVIGMPMRDFGEGRALALRRSGGEWRPGQLLEGHIFRIGSTLEAGARCEDGALEEFPCTNIQLVSHMQIDELGGARGAWVNDVWGWTDPETGRDYALVARRDGTSFVDVTDPSNPRLVGDLPRTQGSPPSVWRDIKVSKNHAYIVADGARSHGMQVFDLSRLRGVTGEPVMFTPDTTYHEVHSAHNVVADTASGFLYVVGANSGGQTCGGGLHMVDAREPQNPVFVGCYNDRAAANTTGYTHDAQCVTYRGPDTRYHGREICIGSNEAEINIADVTDKTNPVTVGRNSYPNVAYAHQGWFDDQQRYFYMNDELDELAGTVAGTRTIVWDLSQLDDPIVAHEYIGPVRSSDHNLFVRGDRVYESNYGSGLRVLDISDRTNPREIGFFDSAPYNEDEPGHSAAQSGAWSNYPFFESGVVIFTSVREGLFIVRVVDPSQPVS